MLLQFNCRLPRLYYFLLSTYLSGVALHYSYAARLTKWSLIVPTFKSCHVLKTRAMSLLQLRKQRSTTTRGAPGVSWKRRIRPERASPTSTSSISGSSASPPVNICHLFYVSFGSWQIVCSMCSRHGGTDAFCLVLLLPQATNKKSRQNFENLTVHRFQNI